MKKGYRCLICGYVHIGSEAPNVCPICGASTGEFELFEDKNKRGTSSSEYWRCVNCEYIHEGSTPPDQCPVCGVTKSEFEAIEKKAAHHISTDNARILIIGGGIAGLSAAEEIRKHSQTAVITIISNEKQLPYYRLNLTRYLSGDVDKRNLEIHPKEWYDQKNITILHGKEVLNIDANNKEVVLDDQVRVQYDTLIVALGAHPFVPPIPGHQKKNVITVRKIEDADFILNKIGETGSCICIGGGILGLEAAGAIAKNGIKVTLLEGAPWLMPRQLNKRASEILKGHLQKIGIEVRDNVRIKEITGNQECDGVLLETGERLPTKLVMITA
ncbi:MAG: FAD-dependent oxidoreductase, partial [Negativicutes bacterium]|nr:FAD-dependent oxidoreductase [Negativicutes bacterium]